MTTTPGRKLQQWERLLVENALIRVRASIAPSARHAKGYDDLCALLSEIIAAKDIRIERVS
jgi:hypothetical protein